MINFYYDLVVDMGCLLFMIFIIQQIQICDTLIGIINVYFRPARMFSTPNAGMPVLAPWKFCRSTKNALMPLAKKPSTPGSL